MAELGLGPLQASEQAARATAAASQRLFRVVEEALQLGRQFSVCKLIDLAGGFTRRWD